jgi:exonuclease VII small subunit
MRFSVLALGLAFTATASVVRRDDVTDTVRRLPMTNAATKDAAAIARLLRDLNTGLKNLNTAISGITKGNAASQMGKIRSASLKMNDLLTKDASVLKSSKPFGSILTAVQLLTPATTALKTANQTVQLILAKRPIILEAKLESKVKEAFAVVKPGLTALIVALPGQLSAKTKKQIEEKIGSPIPPITVAQVGPGIDKLIDGIMDLFGGKTKPEDLAALGNLLGAKGKGGVPSPDLLAGKGKAAGPAKGKTPKATAASKGKLPAKGKSKGTSST